MQEEIVVKRVTRYEKDLTPNKSCNMLLGTAKVGLSTLIPMMKHIPNAYATVVSRSNALSECRTVEYRGHPELNYELNPILSKRPYESVDALFNEGDVVIISSKDKEFEELLFHSETNLIFSACREGLLTEYMPFLEKADHPIIVISVDNDDTIINRAKQLCNNRNVKFYRAIIHSVCSEMVYDKVNKKVILIAEKDAEIVFPPELSHLEEKFKAEGFDEFFARIRLHFPEDENEYEIFKHAKVIDINAIHSLLTLPCYIRGLEQGRTVDEIASAPFDVFLSLDEAVDLAKKAHSEMFGMLAKNYGHCGQDFEAARLAHEARMLRFVNLLYTSNEIVQRGIDLNNELSIKKLRYHTEYLNKVSEGGVKYYVDEIIKLI